jgi:hypothetical protein
MLWQRYPYGEDRPHSGVLALAVRFPIRNLLIMLFHKGAPHTLNTLLLEAGEALAGSRDNEIFTRM